MAGMDPFKIKGRPGWHIRYRDHARPAGKQWVTRKGGDTLREAFASLQKAEDESDLVRRGLVTPRQLSVAVNAQRPIHEVIALWQQTMAGDGVSVRHIADFVRCVTYIVDGHKPPLNVNKPHGKRPIRPTLTRYQTVGAIEPNGVEKFLRMLTRAPYNRSRRTRNQYLVAIKAFMNWSVGRGFAESSPLGCLQKLNEAKDPRRPRRALTHDELARLLAIVDPNSPGHLIYRRPDRGPTWFLAFYLASARCGGRWTELAKLRWEHIDFAMGDMHFAADITKTGESGRVPMTPAVVEALLAIRPLTLSTQGLVFGGQPTRRTFERHLRKADVSYTNEAGHVVSLRKTFGSHLVAAGTHPRTVQLLMRHTNIQTTFKHYSDPNFVDTRGALDALDTRDQPGVADKLG